MDVAVWSTAARPVIVMALEIEWAVDA